MRYVYRTPKFQIDQREISGFRRLLEQGLFVRTQEEASYNTKVWFENEGPLAYRLKIFSGHRGAAPLPPIHPIVHLENRCAEKLRLSRHDSRDVLELVWLRVMPVTKGWRYSTLARSWGGETGWAGKWAMRQASMQAMKSDLLCLWEQLAKKFASLTTRGRERKEKEPFS